MLLNTFKIVSKTNSECILDSRQLIYLCNQLLNILFKALHFKLLTELSGFPSRNEYFVISEVRIGRHFFKVFGKFGISKFPKFPNIRKNQFPKFPNFFRNFQTFFQTFPNFLTKKHVALFLLIN